MCLRGWPRALIALAAGVGACSPEPNDPPNAPPVDPPDPSCSELNVDADGDGYGDPDNVRTVCPGDPTTGVVADETDCDDLDALTHPLGTEVFGDGRDQDCSGEDDWKIFDDFELGMPDPAVFASTAGPVVTTDTATGGHAASGVHAVELGAAAELTSIALDTSACVGMTWSFAVRRPPRSIPSDGAALVAEFHDGTDWKPLRTWLLADVPQWEFEPQLGRVYPPASNHRAFQFRLVTSMTLAPGEVALVDDFQLACAGPDGDDDGYGDQMDCDDTEGRHWFDCGVCVDDDGDGFGSGCDLGDDCNDADPIMAPDQPDLDVDWIDQDCDGMDFMFFDDMEADDDLWWDAGGHGEPPGHSGGASMEFSFWDDDVNSKEFDTSGCDTVDWEFWVLHPPPKGIPPVWFFIEFQYGIEMAWQDTTRLVQAVATEAVDETPDWERFAGTILDPRATHDAFSIDFDGIGLSDLESAILVDDVIVRCGPTDADRDRVIAADDCDDADPDHWWDCDGGCVDPDGDDYGAGCDLGADCDDADGSVHPGAPDPYGDGLDASCDGTDGPTWLDGFELPFIDPTRWIRLDSAYGTTLTTESAHAGLSSLAIYGVGIDFETTAADMSACPSVYWSYAVRRGDGTLFYPHPDADDGDLLTLSSWDGAAWIPFDVRTADKVGDPAFAVRSGSIAPPVGGLPADFALRVEAHAHGGPFLVDGLFFACSELDTDGDGAPPLVDCAEGDPLHWNDCATCVDADLDEHGVGCDPGADCNDGDAAIHPAATEVDGDGVDSDCDGFELSLALTDDFEGVTMPDPNVWSSVTGWLGTGISEFYGATGSQTLRLVGQASALTQPIDTTTCSSIEWSFHIRQGVNGGPADDDRFRVSFVSADGTVVDLAAIPGANLVEHYRTAAGTITTPSAMSPLFAIELFNDTALTDDYEWDVYVDDFAVGCAH
jgi:hypothetical protein